MTIKKIYFAAKLLVFCQAVVVKFSSTKASDQLPHILFVHDYRPDSLVTADLIRQLFRGYPPEKLSWWSFRQTGLHAQPDLHAGDLYQFTMPNRMVPHVRLAGFKSALLEKFWVPRAARHLERVIGRVKPDFVVALLYGWSIPVLAQIRWTVGQRLHVSVWDFPDTNGMKKTLGEERSARFLSAIHQLVQRSDSFDAISPGALAELRLHTNRKDGLLVHSGFEPHHLNELETFNSDGADDVLRLAYVGTIISESGFLRLLAALEKVRGGLSKKVVLEFFGGRNYRCRTWFDSGWMTEHKLFTDDGLVVALRRCDWGIVVMDPEGEDLRYSRFSFPNKVGTYLSAGVPVLGYGHSQSSLARILSEHRLGRFTSADEPGRLENFLAEILQQPSPRQFFRTDILQCARSEFNADEMRGRLWRLWGAG